MEKQKVIYFAGGCFWGTEKYFSLLHGVTNTEAGYANGRTANPDYESVCSGKTGYAETVKVSYDPEKISLPFLLDLYYKVIDPTSLNKQGGDIGTQYRTGIYYTEDCEKNIIDASILTLQKGYEEPVVVEILPLNSYYTAEEYHQDYLGKHPGGYCHIRASEFDMARRAVDGGIKYTVKTKEMLKQVLSPLQYSVTQENATEQPFLNEYCNRFDKGVYVDITTGQPLFISSDKFESGCGWPSFTKPIDITVLNEIKDNTHGMVRTEVRSKVGDSHLGHVFADGPSEQGGMRYCINSASLRFIPRELMEKEGYGQYLALIK